MRRSASSSIGAARHRASFARTLGTTDIEFEALIFLAEHGELAPSAIAALVDVSSGGATALVQRLERSGHVTRRPHPTDRRSTLIALSPRTAARLDAAAAPVIRGLDAVTEPLSEPQRLAVTCSSPISSH